VSGDAWVSGDARVFGHAQVSGDARVSKTPINILGLRWAVTISDHHIQVGCELHLKAEWATFEEERIAHMDGEALEFWNEHRGTILKLAGVWSKSYEQLRQIQRAVAESQTKTKGFKSLRPRQG
jgi:hypothetical protein